MPTNSLVMCFLVVVFFFKVNDTLCGLANKIRFCCRYGEASNFRHTLLGLDGRALLNSMNCFFNIVVDK